MKKFNLRKLTALMLALVMLALSFASCAATGEGEGEGSESTSGATTTAGIDVTEAIDTTPQTDEWGRPYTPAPTPEGTKLEDGTVITVLLRDSATWNREYYAENGENGDMLNDEIYKRNEKLQADLNFTFEFVKSPNKEESERTILAEYQSGGTGLDIVSNYAYYSTKAALRDCYVNLHEIETLNLDNPWWNKTYVEAASIQDQLYFVVGDLNLSVVDRSLAIYYNATLADTYQIPNLYDTVLDGDWTIQKLLEYTKNTWVDTNQSGTIDLADKIGVISIAGSEAYDGFLSAFGIDLIGKTSDNEYEVIWDPEKVSSAIDLQITLFKENQGAFLHSNHAELCNKFVNSEALFWIYTIYASSSTNQSLRSMSDTYGLIPLPKYDDQQENYYSTVQDAYNIMSVMATSAHIDAVGTVLDEWSYRSYCDILPVYCEVIMKTRYLVDVESGMIFDLILNSIKFDTGMVYGSELENIGTSTRSFVSSGSNTFSSTYKAKQRLYSTKLKKLIQDFEERVQ